MNLRLLRVHGSREMHCVMAEEGILLMLSSCSAGRYFNESPVHSSRERRYLIDVRLS
jgi:hypothetical protein